MPRSSLGLPDQKNKRQVFEDGLDGKMTRWAGWEEMKKGEVMTSPLLFGVVDGVSGIVVPRACCLRCRGV